jgi:iron uptake system component EfeO
MIAPRTLAYSAIGVSAVVLVALGVALTVLRPRLADPEKAAAGPKAIAIAVSRSGCDPMSLAVTAGRVTFEITNRSDRVLEWEILKGVMVVDERENIVPGMSQRLTTRLEPGSYEITCGLLSNPKGTLTAAASPSDGEPVAKPSLVAFIGALAEYKVYVGGEAGRLVAATRRFADAIQAGDLAEAQALYGPTREHYDRLAPIAHLFGDLDKRIDPRAADFAEQAADPAFIGFRRIAYGLYTAKSMAGLSPVAERLVADVTELRERIGQLTVPPADLVGGAATALRRTAANAIGHADGGLSGVAADIDGVRKVATLLRPLAEKRDKALSADLDRTFAGVDGVLARYRQAGGRYDAAGQLDAADRKALHDGATLLAEDFSRLRSTLGLD